MTTRGEILEGAPMHYAPANELGVVFLFSHLLKKWRLKVDQIQSRYPDCIAYQRAGGKDEKIRIEFEFKSSNFKRQKHNRRRCDWIVCWEHDWFDHPDSLKIIELRREFGLGFNVWMQPVARPQTQDLDKSDYINWTVGKGAHEDDIVLFYRKKPDGCIKDIFVLTEGVRYIPRTHRSGKEYSADMELICKLRSPLFLKDFQQHQILSTAGFVRGFFQKGQKITQYWPYIYQMIFERNPSVRKFLKIFDPRIIV
jgi:hypothetical protein